MSHKTFTIEPGRTVYLENGSFIDKNYFYISASGQAKAVIFVGDLVYATIFVNSSTASVSVSKIQKIDCSIKITNRDSTTQDIYIFATE
jgi:hypothetical protein